MLDEGCLKAMDEVEYCYRLRETFFFHILNGPPFVTVHSSHSPLNLWVLFAQQPAKGCGFLPSQE
jgi:hypothetical protein